MKYEMEEVVWIIRKELRPSSLTIDENLEAFIIERTENIVKMIHRDHAELKRQLLTNNTNALTGSVPLYELDIIKAWDMMYRYLQSDLLIPGNNTCRRILKINYDRIKNALKGLLWYIQSCLKLYCNRYQKIPNELAGQYRPALQQLIERVEKTDWIGNIDSWLHTALIKPLSGFMDTSKTFDYYHFNYLRHYCDSLHRLLATIDVSNELIKQHLIVQCNNDRDFCHHIIETYRCTGNNLATEQEKLLYYRLELKNIRQLNVTDIHSYDSARPDADTLLSRWLEEEIGFIEKQGKNSTEHVETQPGDTGKIHLHLSVYELALGTRLMMDAKLISEDSFPKIAKYLTANFRTHKKEGLSLESFRKKSYEFERSVVNKIKDKIITLMNLAQKAP